MRQAAQDYKASGYDLIKIGSIPRAVYEAMADTAHEIDMPFGDHIPADIGLVGALNARQASIDHLDQYEEFLLPAASSGAGSETGGLVHLVDATGSGSQKRIFRLA